VSWRSTAPTPDPNVAVERSWYTRTLRPDSVKSAQEHCSVTVIPAKTVALKGVAGKADDEGAPAAGQAAASATPGQFGSGEEGPVAVALSGSST
jgi:hypothetical protein